MSRARPCQTCRRRKTKCIREAGGPCAYCQRQNIECILQEQVQIDPPEPTGIQVDPMEQSMPGDLIDRGPSFLPKDYDSALLVGPSGEQDPYLLQYYEKDEDGVTRFVNSGIHIVDNQVTPVVFNAYQMRPGVHIARELYDRKERIFATAAPYTERLLALYFKFIDWVYPAVDKASFYHSYYFDRHKLHPGIFAGMLALSTIYWKYDSQLCIRQMPPQLTQQLFDLTTALIDHEMSCPTLATVQCQLLYLQRRLSREDPAEMTMLAANVAKLVSTAYTLGLHLDCSHWNVSEREKMIRTRLWALVFTVEIWTSAQLGRPSLLHPSQRSVVTFRSPFPEEQLYVEYYKLSEILEGVISSLYSPSVRYTDFDPTAQTTIDLVSHYFSVLEDWSASLPAELKTMVPLKGDFCRNGQLRLSELTVEVMLLRILLHPHNMARPDYEMFRHKAFDAIQRIMKFTSEITHSHLHAFWLASSSLSFSTVAHFVFYYFVQSPAQERAEISGSVRKWLWALRVLSNAWPEGTGLATLRMDSVFYMGKTQVAIPSPKMQKSAPHSTVPSETRFNTFDGYNFDEEDAILNPEIIPAEEQEQVFRRQEYHKDSNPVIADVLDMEDLVDDSLHDLLHSLMEQDALIDSEFSTDI